MSFRAGMSEARESARIASISPVRATAAALLGALLIVLPVGCSRSESGAQRMAACIESHRGGWHRVTHPFQIEGLAHLDLSTDWVGGPEEEEDGSLEHYDDVYSLNPHVHFELAALGKTPVHEADEAHLLNAVQTDPSAFELVLVSNDAPQTPDGGSGIVEACSDRLYPHQGP
jgi:hypothetical protein